MWSKITNALKPRQVQDDSQGEVLNKVFEQHPNLSMFQTNGSNSTASKASPPPSPSKGTRRGVLKRLSKMPPKDDLESSKSASLRISGPLKKVRPALNFNTVGSSSQLSLAANSVDTASPSAEFGKETPQDVSNSSQDSIRSRAGKSRLSIDVLRRPSLDMLRNELSSPRPQATPGLEEPFNLPPSINDRMGSVRSILREPNTPGTGQNVRFFSRDAYQVLSPDQSMETENHLLPSPPPPPPKDDPPSFLERLNQTSPESTSTPAVFRHTKSNSKSSRPSVAQVFSPLTDDIPLPPTPSHDADMSFASPKFATNSNIFDVSQQLDFSAFPPPGLDFDANGPVFDSSIELDSSLNNSSEAKGSSKPQTQMTSTPFRNNDQSKGKYKISDEQTDSLASLQVVPPPPAAIDETIFHPNDLPSRLPTPLHERSQSFTLGKTVFYSMADSNASQDASNISAAYPSSDLKESTVSSSKPSPVSSTKGRARAISDSMLQNMLRSSPKITPPEADINDESCDKVMVYAAPPAPEPDPFSAHASTYYTPQVMIPTTPPQNVKHTRKTSKEENLIFSLQTQLTLQTELCGQYEADLRARDELVEILGKKVADWEKEDGKRKATLRSWKKKVQELERACRQLEEEVDGSRQMSFERSVMDEASGEALRMLHRQIAALERDKADQLRREDMLREEIATLEGLMKERSEDVMHLKEMLWNRDESERELEAGIRDAKEQMEQMGNVSMAAIDEEELKKLMEEKQQASEQEKARHHILEVTWEQEKAELMMKLESLQVDKASWEDELEKARQQSKNRDEEYAILKSELEAQWSHTETMSAKIEVLEREKATVMQENDQSKKQIEELESRIGKMEVEWNESQNKKAEIEEEVQNLWDIKEALEKDRDQIDYELQQEQERIESLNVVIHERDSKIAQLEQEIQFANETNGRLQDNNRKQDEEIGTYQNRVVEREADIERLREELSTLKREYNRLMEEESRTNRNSSNREAEMKDSIELLIKQKAETDVELKSSRNQVAALKDEVDRLRRHVHQLQQESADKEVENMQLKKLQDAAKEDITGLNMALDAKQQELALIKRNLSVRGTAGMTPAQPSKTHRRDSSIFTATPIPRPPSVLSDSGVEGTVSKKPLERRQSAERPPSSASSSTPRSSTALGKSTRANAASASVKKASASGSMGPPSNAIRPRPSISSVGTPTPTVKGHGRSSSIKPTPVVSPTGTPIPHRRVSSAIVALEQRAAAASTKPGVGKALGRVTSPVPSVAEHDEKENLAEMIGMTASATVPRRRVMVPTPM